MKKVTISKWDSSAYLDSPEMMKEYLQAAFEDGDIDALMEAIGNVAKAKGMSEIARETNLSRQNLYRALSSGSAPKFETVKKVVEALGCKLAVA